MADSFAVALLRGINVGGKNLLPMKSLAGIFASAGCTGVKTYIQSGNVVFRARKPDAIARIVTAEIATLFSLKVPVVIRTASEISKALAINPFLKPGVDENALHVMFLADEPTPAMLAALDHERSRPDDFAIIGREIYLHLPNGAAKTKLTNAYFDSKLKTVSTQRNWRTVNTLAEMMVPTTALAARALSLLDKASGRPVAEGDELPQGYPRPKKK